jgi:hypothetical protein
VTTLARLALKIQRFEVSTAVLLVGVVGILALVVRTRLDGVGATVECFETWLYGAGPFGAGACEGPVTTFFTINQNEAAPIIATMQALPFVVGLILGVALVGREIESGTAATVWTLAGSRRRWLVARLAPVLVVLVGLLAFSAVTSEILALGRSPWVPGGVTFDDVGEHGPGVVARGFAGFAVAVTVGAVTGRMLPAVIVSAALALGMWLAGDVAFYEWMRASAREVPLPANSYDLPGGRIFDGYWRTADGTRLSDDEAWNAVPTGEDPEAWLAENLDRVAIGVPGSDYPRWAMTETIGYGVVAVFGLALAFPIVERRRPT